MRSKEGPSTVFRREILEAFQPSAAGNGDRIGVELELLPTLRQNGTVLPIRGRDGSLVLIRSVAAAHRWVEERSPYEVPAFRAPCGCRISFEPGGQVEVSSPPAPSIPTVTGCVRTVLDPLQDEAATRGVRFVARGIDPVNPVEGAPLELTTPRYLSMARHLERFGLSGRRMMRQTQAIHVNLDYGQEPLRRWRAANGLVPYAVAIFANSAQYGGRPSGYRSLRSHQWRELDPGRSGCVGPGLDPIEEYFSFAMQAPTLGLGPADVEARPFAAWVGDAAAVEAWPIHLTTLFPEVRPRGYLEFRALDALETSRLVVPLTFLSGLLYDGEALRLAEECLRFPSEETLARASRFGLRDSAIHSEAVRLFRLALQGAERLGAFVGESALRQSWDFFERFTVAGLDQGDESASS